MIKIYPLSERKIFFPILAYWAYTNWYLTKKIPFNIILNEYKRRAGDTDPPLSFVALIDDIPGGMVTLKKKDLAAREDLSPWLSTLYVPPEFRRKGVGDELIGRIIAESREMGYKKLYLFIDNRNFAYLEKYYTSRGWQYLSSAPDADGDIAKIYSLTL